MSSSVLVKWIWLLAIGCSAPAHVAQPVHDHACVALAAPSERALCGRVTDAGGQPLAGVTVEEVDDPAHKTQTRADGAYELLTSHRTDAVVRFELDHRQVVWAHLDAPRRVDVELDRMQPAGVLAVRDGLLESGDPCGARI